MKWNNGNDETLLPKLPRFQSSIVPSYRRSGRFFMRHPSLIPLSHDHHHGLALALRCRKQSLGQIKPIGLEGLNERASELRDFFNVHLLKHFRAEEEALFPLMREAIPQSELMIEELTKDHERMRSAMAELEKGTGLGKLIFDVGDLLERHIRREERELFPLFEEQIGAEEAAAVGEKIKQILGMPAGSTNRSR